MGEWLPEPVPEPAGRAIGRPGDTSGDTLADPAGRVTLDESVSMAFLVVLESMTPAEQGSPASTMWSAGGTIGQDRT